MKYIGTLNEVKICVLPSFATICYDRCRQPFHFFIPHEIVGEQPAESLGEYEWSSNVQMNILKFGSIIQVEARLVPLLHGSERINR
jgi:hypothetical protein